MQGEEEGGEGGREKEILSSSKSIGLHWQEERDRGGSRGLAGYGDTPESTALALSMSPAASKTRRVDRSVWGGIE